MSDVDRNEKRKPLTLMEVRQAYEPLGEKYPPLLDLDRAAELSGYTSSTLKKKLSEGAFRNCVSRGKPLLFWRDRFVLDLMNRPWTSPVRETDASAEIEGGEINGGDHEVY